MAEISELEELGRLIMSASVKAEFMNLGAVVSYLDMAFSDVVREAIAVKEAQHAAAVREAALVEKEV